MSDVPFEKLLVGAMPKLIGSALKMTRNRTSAEDLVQDTMVLAMSAKDSFSPGTNIVAWLYTIMRNRFITMVRRDRETVNLDDVPSASLKVGQSAEIALQLKEATEAIKHIPKDHLEPFLLVVVDGMSYEDIAQSTGSAVGTVKSRVYRARKIIECVTDGTPVDRITRQGTVGRRYNTRKTD